MAVQILKEQTTVQEGGRLDLSSRILELAGVHAGDSLVVLTVAPGIIQLRKVQPFPDLNVAEIKQRLRQALIEVGYNNRDKVVRMLREIRQEMVHE